MNLCQDTLQITGKFQFHKAAETQQLEKCQHVQKASFPPKLGMKTVTRLPLPPETELVFFLKHSWSSRVEQAGHVAQPKTSSMSLQLMPVTAPNRLQRPGPLRASMQMLPTKGMGFRKCSHWQQMLRGKEKQGASRRTR